MGETVAAPYLQKHVQHMQVAIYFTYSKFSHVQKFRELNFHNPTPTAKLRKTFQEIR